MDEELDSIIEFLNDKDSQNTIAIQGPQVQNRSTLIPHETKVQGVALVEDMKTTNSVRNQQRPQVMMLPQNVDQNSLQFLHAQQQNQQQLVMKSNKQNESSSKQSEFIIRKTQTKRVMSQIRNQQQQQQHFQQIPKPNNMLIAKQIAQNSSKKKRTPQVKHSALNQDLTDYSDKFVSQPHHAQSQQQPSRYGQLPSSQAMHQTYMRMIEKEIEQTKENQDSQENPQAPQLEQEPQMVEQISSKLKKKFLVFRPYEDPMNIRPYQPPDRGYNFRLHKCDIKIIRYTLEDNGFRESPNEGRDWSIMWSCSALKPQVYQTLQKYQKVNHFPNSFYITRKDLMYKQVSKMREIHGQKHYNFIPKTFLLPNEFVYLEAEMEKDKDKLWIAKPAASSQGKGIIVTNKLSEIPQKGTPHIVSEYINNPLLFDGFKFDLRVYVAITSMNPLRLYIYDEGLTRFATGKYNNSVTGNKKQSKFTHLTNYSLNKYNPNFIANTDSNADGVGSKWSLTALRKAFREQGIDDAAIFKRIEDVVIKTILAAENVIFQACEQYVPFRDNCFELLGFDILIDNLLNPWLLEVNLSPSLNCDSPLDQKIKGQLIADLLTLSGIVPLEQRKAQDGSVLKTKGMYYGAYQQNDLNQSSFGSYKRDSSTANGGRRRDVYGKTNLSETTGFQFGGAIGGHQKQPQLTQKFEKQLIKESEQEFKRRGRFKRVFPSVEYHYYKQFFAEERPLNCILDQRVMSKRRLSNAMQTASMTMKQKMEFMNINSSSSNANNGKASSIIVIQNQALPPQKPLGQAQLPPYHGQTDRDQQMQHMYIEAKQEVPNQQTETQ